MSDFNINNDFDLDLDSIDINMEGEEQAMDKEPEVVNAPVVGSNNQVSKNVSFKFDFGKLNLPGVMVGDIGIEVSRYPVDKIKFTKAKREMISIVTPQVMAIKTHYIDGVGSVLCSGKTCCKVAGAPRIKYLFPVVVYETDTKGKPVSSKLNYKVLCVGEGIYRDIMAIAEVQDITSIDLLVTCKEEIYQDISLTPAGNCRWQSNPKLVEKVVEFWSEHMEDIVKPIAREVDEDTLLAQAGFDLGTNASDVDYSEFI